MFKLIAVMASIRGGSATDRGIKGPGELCEMFVANEKDSWSPHWDVERSSAPWADAAWMRGGGVGGDVGRDSCWFRVDPECVIEEKSSASEPPWWFVGQVGFGRRFSCPKVRSWDIALDRCDFQASTSTLALTCTTTR